MKVYVCIQEGREDPDNMYVGILMVCTYKPYCILIYQGQFRGGTYGDKGHSELCRRTSGKG